MGNCCFYAVARRIISRYLQSFGALAHKTGKTARLCGMWYNARNQHALGVSLGSKGATDPNSRASSRRLVRESYAGETAITIGAVM
jgi:hypothetical protein